jgi:hypothetical protein
VDEILIPYDHKQFLLYREGSEECIFPRWELPIGKGKWGEFPLVVARAYFEEKGYKVLASEPNLPNQKGFILLSFPGKRESGDPAYTKMACLLGTEQSILDELNREADKEKIEKTPSRGGGDPDLFIYKPDCSDKFFVEVKWKDELTPKQNVTFPLIRKRGWRVEVARIVKKV